MLPRNLDVPPYKEKKTFVSNLAGLNCSKMLIVVYSQCQCHFSMSIGIIACLLAQRKVLVSRRFVTGWRGGEGSPIGQYGYVPCESPHFKAFAAPKLLLFLPGPLQKTPFSKNIQFCVPLFRLARSKNPCFKKNIRFFLIFSSEIPCFPCEGPL